MKIMKRQEVDRPSSHSLRYLTTVRPHHINREPWLVDPFVKSTLEQFFGLDVVQEFGRYTRSFYTLEGHYSNLWKYDRPILPKPTDPVLDHAIWCTAQDFRLNQPVTAIDWWSLKDVPFIPSSSAGYNFIGKKGDPGNHELAINRAVMSLNMWLEDRERGTDIFRYHPDLAWTRTQLGTVDDPKIRNVWGTAFGNIILEGMSAHPLIVEYRKVGHPMAVGMNYYKRLPSMIQKCLYDNEVYKYGVAIDFKSFDSSIQPWMINEAFNILERNIVFPDDYSKHAFDYSRHFFIHRPVVMPDGRMWLKHLGIPSGSYFTQLIGSICNMIATHYAQLKLYGNVFETFVLGDDSLFGIPVELGEPKLTDFSPHFEYLGLQMHPNKGVVTIHPGELDFLGHCARGSKLDRASADLMRLALYPEYPVTGPAQSLNRVKGIMLDSALNNWPILHLHDFMTIRYRNEYEQIKDEFIQDDKDWLRAVLDIQHPPSNIDGITTFMLT